MVFRIADTFSDSLAKLTNQEQKAVKTAAFDLQMNPDSPGLSMHRVDRAKDKFFWTARVNRDLRLVVHKKDSNTLLAWVGHHDDAYRWAETRRIDTHPRTGAAQIVEIRETVEEIVVQKFVEETASLPRIFTDQSEDILLSWGVPTDWIDTVKGATEDTVLDIASHLPMEAAEALLLVATGGHPQPIGISDDPFEHPDASRRFKVLENEVELAAALEAPWEKWTTFLHPAQRDFVTRDFNGPARVIGSAGTGKTIVALHRAVRLAKENPKHEVLLATFNDTLVASLQKKVAILAPSEVASRILVSKLDDFAKQEAEELGWQQKLLNPLKLEQIIEQVLAYSTNSFSEGFIKEEWNEIIDAWGLETLEDYLNLPRLGRRVRLAPTRRKDAWAIFKSIKNRIEKINAITQPQMFHKLARHYKKNGTRPVTHLIVDEAQDLSAAELIYLSSIGNYDGNSLFFSGDIGQRIFRSPFPWSATGISITGRSRTLRLNYRTSEQIRRSSDKLLPATITESDGNVERRDSVVSLFQGNPPAIIKCTGQDEEISVVSDWLADRLAENTMPDEIAILFRSVHEMDRANLVVNKLGLEKSDINILTMHSAKGLEFKSVALIGCEDTVIPSQYRLEQAKDEAELDEIMATERHLLYVAFSRARENVLITCVGTKSEFLIDLEE